MRPDPLARPKAACAEVLAIPSSKFLRARGRFLGAFACWIGTGLVLWAGAQLTCPAGACRALGVDRVVLDWLQSLQWSGLDAFLMHATWLGSIALLLPAALTSALIHARRRDWPAASLMAGGLAGVWLITHTGKFLIERPRPDLYAPLVAMPSDLSFPSAHVAQVTAFSLAWCLTVRKPAGYARAAIASALIALVAVSRMYLQVHFPSDVIAALLVAAGWVLGLWLWLGAARPRPAP
jgi:membrane-associated phospholipid phosphatase